MGLGPAGEIGAVAALQHQSLDAVGCHRSRSSRDGQSVKITIGDRSKRWRGFFAIQASSRRALVEGKPRRSRFQHRTS